MSQQLRPRLVAYCMPTRQAKQTTVRKKPTDTYSRAEEHHRLAHDAQSLGSMNIDVASQRRGLLVSGAVARRHDKVPMVFPPCRCLSRLPTNSIYIVPIPTAKLSLQSCRIAHVSTKGEPYFMCPRCFSTTVLCTEKATLFLASGS